MKKINKLLLVALLTMVCIILFTGCSDTNQKPAPKTYKNTEEQYDDSEFLLIETQRDECLKIICTPQNNVIYAQSIGSYNGGNLTMLLEPDGSPKIYNPEENYESLLVPYTTKTAHDKSSTATYMLYDRQNGVMYAVSNGVYNMGNIQTLYGPDNKPMTTEGSK